MTKIQKAISVLVKTHGTYRAAAEAVGLDHGYLHHLATGKRANPTDDTLAKLGLVRRTTYAEAPR